MSPSKRRRIVRSVQEDLGVSERKACRAVGQPRSTQRREPKVREDEARLVARILEAQVLVDRWRVELHKRNARLILVS